jgi:UDP-3-O-[3-hydroxymyristoyl] glucosamine N-acyltransferase
MIRLSQIRELLNCPETDSNGTQQITQVLSIDDAGFDAESLGWCSDKNKENLAQLTKGNVIVSHAVYEEFHSRTDLNLVPVEKPRSAFLKTLQEFFAEKVVFGFVHPTAVIDPSVTFNSNMVNIAANVVIEKDCVIGDRVSIGANSVLKSGCQIGNDCSIGSNNTIGGIGFGYELNEENTYELMPHIGNVYELNEENTYELMPHIGNVVLKDHVEIGNNVCIDRAVLGSTLLEENVKVDNLVHIAHGVKIGKNSLIIANAMIAGSVEIGENVWVSPSSSIRQKLSVGDNALVGLGSVVVKNVQAETVVAGNPAKPFEKK